MRPRHGPVAAYAALLVAGHTNGTPRTSETESVGREAASPPLSPSPRGGPSSSAPAPRVPPTTTTATTTRAAPRHTRRTVSQTTAMHVPRAAIVAAGRD